MPSGSFATRIGELIELNGAELDALQRLESRERPVRRGAVLLRENDRLIELFVLRQGTMMSYVLLDDGSRQILRFLYPGDLVATAALAYRTSPETIVALTDAVVSPFERSTFAALIADHPRVALACLAAGQVDRVALADRLATVGRASALGRVASILVELQGSLKRRGLDTDGPFALGLTQEEIGDAVGLTAVHVNRMMRQLEDEGLIARQGGRVTILDEATLTRAANHVDRRDHLDLQWVPANAR